MVGEVLLRDYFFPWIDTGGGMVQNVARKRGAKMRPVAVILHTGRSYR